MLPDPDPLHVRPAQTVDAKEISHFDAMAEEWWDPNGPASMLLKLNPARISFILENLIVRQKTETSKAGPLSGIKLLDVGCGGGILSEPMARLGAEVTGIDASSKNINVAQRHATNMNLQIHYLCKTLEDAYISGQRFDVVLAMEILEHVADKDIFLKMLAAVVKPGGSLFVSTFNKTIKAYGMAILGAEYLFNILPRGTHDWKKFTRPSSLIRSLASAGMHIQNIQGVSYLPLQEEWGLTEDLKLSYILHATNE